jgi:DNA-binding transcriptional ArsR family regulator
MVRKDELNMVKTYRVGLIVPYTQPEMARQARHDEEALHSAFTHPLRRTLLRLCLEAKEPLSPKGLSRMGDYRLSNVSYHVRVLAECGALEIVSERPVRGSTEHFYEVTPLVKETSWIRSALGLTGKG